MTDNPDILQELQRIKEDESLFPETCSNELLTFIKENDEGWYQMRAGQELTVRESGRALVAIPKEDDQGNVVHHEKTGKPVVDFTYTIGNARRGVPDILCFYPSPTGGFAINNFSEALINKEVNLPSGKDPEVATGMFEDKSLTVIYQWITGDKRKLAADKYACQLKDDDPLLLLMLPTPDGQHHIQFIPEEFLDGVSSTPEPSGEEGQSTEGGEEFLDTIFGWWNRKINTLQDVDVPSIYYADFFARGTYFLRKSAEGTSKETIAKAEEMKALGAQLLEQVMVAFEVQKEEWKDISFFGEARDWIAGNIPENQMVEAIYSLMYLSVTTSNNIYEQLISVSNTDEELKLIQEMQGYVNQNNVILSKLNDHFASVTGSSLEIHNLKQSEEKSGDKEEMAYGDLDLSDEECIKVRDTILDVIADKLNSDTSVKEDLTVLYSYFCNFLGWMSQEGYKQSPRSKEDIESAIQIINNVFDKTILDATNVWGMSEEELIATAEYSKHLRAFEVNNLNFASVVQTLVALNNEVMLFIPELASRALEKEDDNNLKEALERTKSLAESSIQKVEKALQLLHRQ